VPQTIVITGASDGVGAAAVRRLRQNGHHLVVVGRDPDKTRAVASETGADPLIADFAKLDEVARLAGDLNLLCTRIDVLANNAGRIFDEHVVTGDGFERNFQVNYLAPYLLTRLLMGKLIASRASVIQTSSVAARMLGRVDLARLGDPGTAKDFHALRAYGAAKLANNLFTRELHRRHHADGLAAAAFHPGAVASNFAADSQGLIKYLARSRIARVFMVTPEKGARQLTWLAETNPGTDWISGVYYEDGRPARRNNPQAFDDDLARGLWERSEQLLGHRLAA
jgi:NAD(P)-dependent dehydrogenase (short-subunit alcohol dehydrogenase family)